MKRGNKRGGNFYQNQKEDSQSGQGRGSGSYKKGYNNDSYNTEETNSSNYSKKNYNNNYDNNYNSENNQGYNNQGYNSQGYNNQGYNSQGYNNQGYNNQGYNNQGYYNQGYNNNNNYYNQNNEEENYEEQVEDKPDPRLKGMYYQSSNSNYSRKKGDPFSKNTHANQQQGKREYKKNNPNYKPDYYSNTGVDNKFNNNITNNVNTTNSNTSTQPTVVTTTPIPLSKSKLLDIEISENDREKENEEERAEISKYLKQIDVKEQEKELRSITSKKDQVKNKEENIIQEIINKCPKIYENIDIISNMMQILTCKKSDDEIQGDLIDLLGEDCFEVIIELIQNRKEIKELYNTARVILEEDINKSVRKDQLRNIPNASISIEYIGDKKKKKAMREEDNLMQQNKTNLMVLQQLGFNERYIKENNMLGLQEKKVNNNFNNKNQEVSKYNTQVTNNYNDPSKQFKQETNKHKDREHGFEYTETIVWPNHLDRKQVNLVKTCDIPAWCQPCFNFKEFNEIQSTVFNAAFKGDNNILISAPTGAGKTNIALLTILREISKNLNSLGYSNININDLKKINWTFKIVYLVPLKALANEIVNKFTTQLSFLNIKVSEFSADVNLSKEQIDNTHLFIAIPEKWDLFTRKNEEVFSSLKLVIIDEVHLLNEDRGRVLECIVARTVRKSEVNQKFIRLVGLSATLPNYWDVASFLNVDEKENFYFDASYRATPLEMKFLGIEDSKLKRDAYLEVENQILFNQIVKYLDMEKQVLVFVHSRNDTINIAKDIINRAQSHHRGDLFVNGKMRTKVRFSNRELESLFPYGIGFHNAGVLRKDRNLVETLFQNKVLNVLVSTSTLAWGVNLPAYAVIIKGVQYYDATLGEKVDMGILDVQQMFGRAGRPQYDKEGVAMIICQMDKTKYYISMLKNQIDIESKLPKFLEDALNAEVSIGNILNVNDAVSWLGFTYFSIRLEKNPNKYNIVADKDIRFMDKKEKLACIAQQSFERLNKSKLLRYLSHTGAVHSTELGRIATKYYMSYQSISKFYDKLQIAILDEEFLKLFAESEEFKNIKINKEEKGELDMLNTKICSLFKSESKPIILLQAYLQNFSDFKNSSLYMDTAYIIDTCPRILRAMFEICLHKHLIETTFLALNYVKYIERKVFPGNTPLWQFTYASATNSKKTTYHGKSEGYISEEICRKIDQSGLQLQELYKEDCLVLSKALNLSKDWISSIKDFISSIPRFKMTLDYKPITRTILNITINLKAIFKWKARWNHTIEPFWILVDDGTEIIHYEPYSMSCKQSSDVKGSSITFAVPFQIESGSKEARIDKIYRITLISDRWVGTSFTESVYLADIEVPFDQDVHTELLDLNPLPLSALNNKDFEKIFSYKFFNPIQTQVFFSCYHTDQNILVGAPTGSGKTVVAELAMLRVFKNKENSKIIYIAPLKSLAKERVRDWTKKLGLLGKKVLELSGDFTPDVKLLLEADVLITTPEKWDGVSRNWHHRVYVQRVALVIIDEIHLLGLDRGPVLEVIVSRMRYIAEKTKSAVRFVGLSTALANSYDVATWLGIETKPTNKISSLYNFKPAVRPCPVTVHIEGFAEKHYCPRMGTMNKPSFQAIMEFSPKKPVLIFVSSRRQTRLTALDLISLCANESNYSHRFLKINEDEMRLICETVKDENLRHTLMFGIGMHHAGLVENDRRVVEDLFYNQSIQILVATSTVAWGVNFPAHLVIIKGTEYFDPKVKSYVDMPITDILQMIGRAGRPQYDDSAVACLYVTQEKKNFYKKFLYEPFPLESSLHKVLHEHLNAEIASGTLTSKVDCVEYMTWTYFFRRLIKNPSYYCLAKVDAKSLNEFLNKLVSDCLDELFKSKCITIHDEGQINSTLLGYLSSYYYIFYKTAYYFEMTLKAGLEVNTLIEILSEATEFDGLPVRHNEEDLNEELSKICPFEVNHLHLDSPHVKANLLLQAYFSRAPLPISDYYTDLQTVIDNCIRIILFMIDIAGEKGFLDTSINLIILMQMVLQGVWIYDSSIMTLPDFGIEEVMKLKNKKGICHLPELIEEKENLESIMKQCDIKLNTFELKKLKNILNGLPLIKVSFKLYALKGDSLERIVNQPIIPGNEVELSVRLEKVNKEFDNLLLTAKYPKIKTCRWWLLIGNQSTNELLSIKKVGFRNFANKNMNFTLPKNTDSDALKLYLFSDSYFGLDQEYTIDIESINNKIIKRYNLSKQDYYNELNRVNKNNNNQNNLNKKQELRDDFLNEVKEVKEIETEKSDEEESEGMYEDEDDFLQDII